MLPPILLACLLWGIAPAREARACQACACGDVTFASVDLRTPWVLNLGLHGSFRREVYGEGLPYRFDEWRSDLTLGLTTPRLSAGLRVPLVHRTLEIEGLRVARGTNLSDVEAVLFGHLLAPERAARLRRQFLVHAGVVLPTGPEVRAEGFDALPHDVQPGTGSVTPFFGWGFLVHWARVRLDGRQSLYLPLPSRFDYQVGMAFQSRARAMVQVLDPFAFGGGLYAQWSGAMKEEGVREEDTGGFLLSLDVEAELRPVDPLVVYVGLRVPVVQGLYGDHEGRPGFYAGLRWEQRLRREPKLNAPEERLIVQEPRERL